MGDGANRRADELLQGEVARLGYDAFPVTGGSADFAHAEPGYGTPCSREVALALARQFRQQALFEVTGGKVFLISASANPSPDEEVGGWEVLRAR